MAEVMRRSDLVVALATVTISALSGPLGPMGVAVARELVKASNSVWDRTSPERQLRNTVQASIEAWAKGEKVPADIVDRGLGWAVEYVQAAGGQYGLIAEADFDPSRAAASVLDHVKGTDRYWGTELEYAVAERAVGATYQALCARLKTEGGLVLAAVQASRNAVLASVAQLHDGLLGVADRSDLCRYLRAKIVDWDYSPWTLRSPALLERDLQLDTRDGQPERVAAAEALAGRGLLVVLGGPGSGKTWLGQRYAREAAQAALAELEDPRVDPALVEIPLLTSWAGWALQPSGGVDGLVSAALPATSEERIRRFVLRPGARVLAVADSLDEAGVGENRARTLLRSLPGPVGWRVVVTSRPEAWHTTAPGLRPNEGVRIGTLVDLSYPEDVDGYIRQWFTGEPVDAERLIKQIANRPELRSTATVPLLLTFYCMLTEQDPGQDLPWTRRGLYRAIIDRLLTGGWSVDEPERDLEECRTILQDWAWGAVAEAVTAVGLGAWPNTITTEKTRSNLERGLDHVAPKQQHSTMYDRTHVQRRFVHRALVEHSVAEKIATFPAAKAAEALLPHVWFDPDWAATVPMAIAAHPERDTVVKLLWAHHSTTLTPAQEAVNTRLEDVLLEAATQTLPEDWGEAGRSLIHDLRAVAIVRDPQIVVRSARWTSSNPQAIHAILDALPGANWRVVGGLVGVLPALEPTEVERVVARDAILAAVPGADPFAVGGVVGMLPALVVTEVERAVARDAILAALSGADRHVVGPLVGVLPALVVTEVERVAARDAILAAVPGADRHVVGGLVGVLSALEPTEVERAVARDAILAALPGADRHVVGPLVGVLPALVVTEVERVVARDAILAALSGADRHVVGPLVGVLPALVVTEVERAVARDAILAALPGADPFAVERVVRVLPALVVTEVERVVARDAILAAVPGADRHVVGGLVGVLSALEPTEVERAVARDAILAALPGAEPFVVRGLVGVLPALVVTEVERAVARDAILAALPGAEPFVVRGLVGVLPALVVTEVERAVARDAILAALSGADPFVVGPLVGVLPALVVTEMERVVARDAILAALPGAERHVVGGLVGVLSALEPTEVERAVARDAILAALPGADRHVVGGLVGVLPALEPTEVERAVARDAILAALPGADPFAVGGLVGVLPALVVTEVERAVARDAILAAVPGADRHVVGGLVGVLPALVVTEVERAVARDAILAALSGADRHVVGPLVGVLPALVVTEVERAVARDAILAAVPGADRHVVGGLVGVLSALVVTEVELAVARDAVLALLPTTDPSSADDLLGALRLFVPVLEWLELAATAYQ